MAKYYLVHEIEADNLVQAISVHSEIKNNTGLPLRLILDESEFNVVRNLAGKKIKEEGEEVSDE